MEILSWDDLFASIASLSSMRSKDAAKCNRAVCSEDNRIVGIGYNGLPRGVEQTDLESIPEFSELSNLFVCHATMNAVVNKNQQSLRNCKIYCTHFPCNECAKIIAQVGIKKIFYSNEAPSSVDCLKTQASQKIFDSAGVKIEKLRVCKAQVFLPLKI